MNKLPKQWKHWCQQAGLRLYSAADRYSRRESAWYYLKGHGRVWRVNCYGMLQCGDRLAEFDRWALCRIAEVEMPTSQRWFKQAVIALRNAARTLDSTGWPDDRNVQLVMLSCEALPAEAARYNPLLTGDPEVIAQKMLELIPRSEP